MIRLLFFLARRNLLGSRLGTILLVAAVAAGTGFQIPNAANQRGYEETLVREAATQGFGDIRLRPRSGLHIEDGDALAAKLKSHPGVRDALPVLFVPAVVKRGASVVPTIAIGVDNGRGQNPFRLVKGEPLLSGDGAFLLVGEALADTLRVHPGDRLSVRLFFAEGSGLVDEEKIGRYTMTVSGIAGGAFGPQDSIIVDRSFVLGDAGTPHEASMVLVYTDDPFAAPRLAELLEKELPSYSARVWLADSSYASAAIEANRAISTVSRVMVFVAVAIPVLALLYINVLGRRREIGLMTALGLGSGDIFLVFLVQTILVGLMGGALGSGIGYGLIVYFQSHPLFAWRGFVVRPVLEWRSFVEPLVVVLSATLLAGVYPAIRAAKIDSSPVLRGVA